MAGRPRERAAIMSGSPSTSQIACGLLDGGVGQQLSPRATAALILICRGLAAGR